MNIDTQKLDKAIQQAFDKTVEIQSEYFDQAITGDNWEWPRATIRSDGSIAGSPRDIVDTGTLLNSKVISRSTDGTSAEYTWDTDYAIYVHEGATTKNGTESPARPWAESGIKECDPRVVFSKELGRLL